MVHNGVVTTVATATKKSASLYEQSCDALQNIDVQLQEAGTDKSKILTVMAYVTDVSGKHELNRAWDEWVDRDNLPLRACVGVELEDADLVELVVTAAVDTA